MSAPGKWNAAVLAFFIAALLVSGCATPSPQAQCPFELSQVLSECGLPEVKPVQAVAWRRMVDERPWVLEKVVLVGKQSDGYLLIAAGRNPRELNPNFSRWSISEISVMYVDGRERWIIGKQEFPQYPTKRELADFLDYIWWERNQGFRVEFDGRQALNGPTRALSQ